MTPFARCGAIALAASLLAAAAVPCTTAPGAEHAPIRAVHAATTAALDAGPALGGDHAGPCPGHAHRRASSDPGPSTWLENRCPCGCGTATPPGGVTARTGPALLLASVGSLCAPERALIAAAGLRLIVVPPTPPDHVPLAA